MKAVLLELRLPLAAPISYDDDYFSFFLFSEITWSPIFHIKKMDPTLWLFNVHTKNNLILSILHSKRNLTYIFN